MDIAIEYEHGKYIEFDGDEITYFLGVNHEIKWKLYRGLKRFSTGKNLSDFEENVYGDDGIVIKCDDKKMKAKDLPIYFLDCRESFLEQYRYSKGSMVQKYIDSMEDDFQVNRQIESINDDFLKLEVGLQNRFSQVLTHVSPIIKPLTYKEMIKYFLELSYYENDIPYPVEMMDISMLVDDYCRLLKAELIRAQKKTWFCISNPSAFISKSIFPQFIESLKKIGKETGLLHIFIMSDDYFVFPFKGQDIPNTVILYDSYQQLPDYGNLVESLARYYPNEVEFNESDLTRSLYRIIPYIGWKTNTNEVYLKPKDMILLKVTSQLLNCFSPIKCTELEDELSELERKFLLS
ncbi:hypothetical protein IGI37_003040 [Enterococcus sp. AZ194]|uniref:CRISPR-associated protein Csn2-St n=1 Tax=Enterococcus sp. AZ194 TaxID=2774629 RepID=UPI003F2917B7